MSKKGRDLFVKQVSVLEISLLVLASFAIAFFMRGSLVSADIMNYNIYDIPKDIPVDSGVAGGTSQSLFSELGNAPASLDSSLATTNLGRSITGSSSSIPSAAGSPVQTTTMTPIPDPTPDPSLFDKGLPPVETPGNYKAFGVLDTGLIEGGAGAHLLQGVVWAGVVYGAARFIGPLVGLDDKNSNTLGLAGAAGIMSYKASLALFGKSTVTSTGGPGGAWIKPLLTNGQAGLIGIGVAVAIFVLLYKKASKKMVSFECLPYEPPLGGSQCEECNKDPFRPCSEYRCKSLGQACELLNKGNAGKEQCAWVSKFDVNSPTITPWNQVLSPNGLKYIQDTSVRPPALGVKVVSANAGGCLQAFTPLKFGIQTNEPAQCKIDYNHTTKFDEMAYYFGESNYYEYNHTQIMRLPAPDNSPNATVAAPILKNDGTFSLYVRCRDANGNENVDEYSISFCVDKSPDTTPPIVEGTSISTGSPVRFGSDSVPIEVYVNEPAECKWSQEDKAYEDMENGMTCSEDAKQVNNNVVYYCGADLTGVKDRASNKYFFRCKDQPDKEEADRNVMKQSYQLTLRGSQPLNIIKTAPNETIYGSTSAVNVDLEVETSNGAEEGKAACYFSTSTNLDSFIPMFETNSFKHKQTLTLGTGDYTYQFRCVDAGGNTAAGNTSFSVIVDKQAPIVTRAYNDLGAVALKVVTNEDAECSYSLTTCNFNIDEGIKMVYNPVSDKRSLFAEWKPTAVYHIRCKDGYGNEVSPNTCNLVASAIQLSTTGAAEF